MLWCHERSKGAAPGAGGYLLACSCLESESNCFRVRDKVNKQCRFCCRSYCLHVHLFCFLVVLVGLLFSVVNPVDFYYRI